MHDTTPSTLRHGETYTAICGFGLIRQAYFSPMRYNTIQPMSHPIPEKDDTMMLFYYYYYCYLDKKSGENQHHDEFSRYNKWFSSGNLKYTCCWKMYRRVRHHTCLGSIRDGSDRNPDSGIIAVSGLIVSETSRARSAYRATITDTGYTEKPHLMITLKLAGKSGLASPSVRCSRFPG